MPDSQEIHDQLGTFGDAFYERLMAMHADLSGDESHALNARLVLLMANEIGDFDRLAKVMKAAVAEDQD